MATASSWDRFCRYNIGFAEARFALDVSRVPFPDDFLPRMEPEIRKAYAAMVELEKGAVANPDEKRMVGHYWLRSPELAPSAELRKAITDTVVAIEAFTAKVHSGEVKGSAGKFDTLLCIGIGGSALGPQFVADALGHPATDKLRVLFLDNTDPDGFDRVFAALEGKLARTLVVVTSKSGSTPEPRNGMIETAARYKAAGLDFGAHAVAVTGEGSELDKAAVAGGFLARFPMWDWVGGRTSELCAVGLLPAALQGLDIRGMLAGAREMDALTRSTDTLRNPAALLALMWWYETGGKGAKDMVILPYKDRLLLLSRYLQQLIMESLGKEKDLAGKVVNQGIAVYGNKGSTDQHAYVQQLREGVNNFFATFIEVLRDRETPSAEVEPGVTAGDYLEGFLLGTREALTDMNRGSITITVDSVSAHSVGQLIALFERAVGFYATLAGINAYHQPGVEAGKKAAAAALSLQAAALGVLRAAPGKAFSAYEIAAKLELDAQSELIFKLLSHIAANPGRGVFASKSSDSAGVTFTFNTPKVSPSPQ
jgi:glucose-6-phosphate isomerase